MSVIKFHTIGVYGFSENAFFNALESAQIDTFCDIRLRRGMRGKKYSFVNSSYLQNRLKDMGIKYLHIKKLAPSKETRNIQKYADKKAGNLKQNRLILSQDFVQEYKKQCLSEFKTADFLEIIGENAKCAVLFCVEKEYTACHRSIVSSQIEKELSLKVNHIMP